MIRTAIYCRVSQDREGKEVSVGIQEEDCRALAEARGFTVTAPPFVDNDRGASTLSKKKRPRFEELMERTRAGEFDAIVAWSTSRLTRRTREFDTLIDLYTATGVRIYTTKSGDPDFSTADGRASAKTLAVWDAAEAERTGERVKASVEKRLSQGKDLGGPRPFGWEKDRQTIREVEADALRAGYQMVLDGGTIYGVAKLFTNLGILRDSEVESGKPWRTQTVRGILLSERNAGRLVVNGITYREDGPSIIDPETFDQVRAVLTNPARAPKRGPVPVTYPGLQSVVCGVCGNALSIVGSKPKNQYRCHHEGRPDWSKNLIHPTMTVGGFDKHLSSKLFYVVGYMAMTGQKVTALDSSIPGLRIQLAEFVRQRDLAQEMMFLRGANIAQAKKKLSSLGEDIEATEQALAAALGSDVATSAITAAVEALSGLQSLNNLPIGSEPEAWLSHWSSLSVTEKRTLTKALLPGARLLRVQDAQKGQKGVVKNRIARGTSKPFQPSR